VKSLLSRVGWGFVPDPTAPQKSNSISGATLLQGRGEEESREKRQRNLEKLNLHNM